MEPIDLISLQLVEQGFNVRRCRRRCNSTARPRLAVSDSALGPSSCWRAPPSAKRRGATPFIGLDRRWRVTTHEGATEVEGTDGGDPSLAPSRRPSPHPGALPRAHAATLPDFGGAVGFVTYDYVRRLERLPRETGGEHVATWTSHGAVLTATTSSTRPPRSRTPSSKTARIRRRCSNAPATNSRRSSRSYWGVEPPSDPATERLVGTTWKTSPANTCSRARSTTSPYAAPVKLESPLAMVRMSIDER